MMGSSPDSVVDDGFKPLIVWIDDGFKDSDSMVDDGFKPLIVW